VPATQLVQLVEPEVVVYWPRAHVAQADAAGADVALE
jgi:hypothetical protein